MSLSGLANVLCTSRFIFQPKNFQWLLTKVLLQVTVCFYVFLNMMLHRCNYTWIGCWGAWMSFTPYLLCGKCPLFFIFESQLIGMSWEIFGHHCFSSLWTAVFVSATITMVLPSLLISAAFAASDFLPISCLYCCFSSAYWLSRIKKWPFMFCQFSIVSFSFWWQPK